MKTPTRKQALVGGGAAILALAFLGSLADETVVITLETPVPSQALVTPEPTPVPTATPTATPTAEPTPAPTPTPDIWNEYLNHQTAVADYIIEEMNRLSAALENLDAPEALGYAQNLRGRLSEEIRWLDDHDPDACYAEVHDLTRQAYVLYEEGMGYAIAWLEIYPFGDDSDVSGYIDTLTDANRALDRATAALEPVDCPV
jgi:hypothetical protein